MVAPVWHTADQKTALNEGTTITVDKPDNVVEGDLLVAAVTSRQSSESANQWGTLPSGWARVRPDEHDTSPNRPAVCLFYKVATASEPSTYQWSSGPDTDHKAVIGRVTGHDPTDPIGAHSGANSGSDSTSSLAIPSLNADGGLLVAAWVWDGRNETVTLPGSMSTVVNLANDTNFPDAVVGREDVLDGATGTRTASRSNSNARAAGAMFEIPSGNQPPTAPSNLTPDGTNRDFTKPQPFSWQHNDPDNDDQNGWAFRRKVGSDPYEYWDATEETWEEEIVWNPGSTQGYTFPVDSWDNGVTYNWSVATEDTQSNRGPFAADATVTGGLSPTATVLAPSGTVVDTSQPTVEWTYFHPTTEVTQNAFHIKVFTEAVASGGGFNVDSSTAAWDSEVVTSEFARSRQIGTELDNLESYRIFIRVRSSENLWSEWDDEAFDLNLSPPSAPTLVVEVQNSQGRIKLTATGTHDPMEFPDATARFQYQDAGQSTWSIVRGADDIEYDGELEAVAYDYEAVPKKIRKYRVRTRVDI